MRSINKDDIFSIAVEALDVSHARAGNVPGSNAVLPAWRNAIMSTVVLKSWNFTVPLGKNVAWENEMTNTIMPQLDAIASGSGIYLNEANFQQKDWKENFYGSNYEGLRTVKRKHDPEDLFYAVTAVGSDA